MEDFPFLNGFTQIPHYPPQPLESQNMPWQNLFVDDPLYLCGSKQKNEPQSWKEVAPCHTSYFIFPKLNLLLVWGLYTNAT